MKIIKCTALLLMTLWSFSVWHAYFEKKSISRDVVVVQGGLTSDMALAYSQDEPLSDAFWEWEAAGKLNLVDRIIDDPVLMAARKENIRHKDDLHDVATKLIATQMKAYDVDNILPAPKVVYTPLRGDANGLYIPIDKTIYLNKKMKWDQLRFERFAEVILHENMHHIMTHMHGLIRDDHPLRNDFEKLAMAAMTPYHLANDNHDVEIVNIQEFVAYKTQRAARYAGLQAADLSVWEMSIRMQEIRVITDDAGL